MRDPRADDRVVVVGIDGSADSLEALRWAARYVEDTGGELHAVTAYENELGFGFAPLSAENHEHEASLVLEHALHKVLGDESSINVVREVVRGHATKVLIDASRNARLLVVGNRGYGGFAGLLLGSVSENCVRHAHCSVLVVRARR